MNKWLTTKNSKLINKGEIPVFSIDELRKDCIEKCTQGARPILFFGKKEEDRTVLYTVLANDEASRIEIASAVFGVMDFSYQSFTRDCPPFAMFEREFYENSGIMPLNHPWLKPVRYPFYRHDLSKNMGNYPFFSMEGDEVHEVAVGPVHAGIIEPGHFRFMCGGEDVFHLEIQLGYQHRGVEKLFLDTGNGKPVYKMHLAESIAGDTTLGHAMAYAQAMESLSGIQISSRAMSVRCIALELERIAVHIGDLGAISNDVAYLLGNAVFGATRTLVINTLLKICGSRFGKGLIRVGGVAHDINEDLKHQVQNMLLKIEKDVTLMSEILFSSPSVLSRLEHTGIVDRETALKIGLVGMAARASGVSIDCRADQPCASYRYFPVYKRILETGDVFARSYIRYLEIQQSIKFIGELLNNFSEKNSLLKNPGTLTKNSLVISMVEGWRGEIVHCFGTDRQGNFDLCKIKDPSFHNWYGLALAVRDNGVSDFPLCNKSFNLSYCGHDL